MRIQSGEHSLSQQAMGHTGVGGFEPWQEKVSRELTLIGAGLSAAKTAAQESVSEERLPATLITLGTSVVAGVVMAKLAPAKGIVGFAGKSLSIGMGTAFLADVAAHARELAGAAADTWDSDSNMQGNAALFETHLGRFAFDCALGTAGGATGMRLGKNMFPTKTIGPIASLNQEPGIFQSGRQLSQESQAALDAVIPLATRTSLAKRSMLYSSDRAFTFAIALEQAVPGLEGRIARSLSKVRTAQKEEFLVRVKENGGPFIEGGKAITSMQDFLNLHYTKAIPKHESVVALNRELAEIQAAVNPVIAETAKQTGFPAPRLVFETNLSERGNWQKGLNKIVVNAEKVRERGDFAKTAYHELTHAEQTNLVLRRIADELKLPANPSVEEQALLFQAFRNYFDIQRNYTGYSRALSSYVIQSLKVRDGKPLGAVQEARAIELMESFRGLVYKSRTDAHYKAMNKYLGTSNLNSDMKAHLLYRSSVHEIEAWEIATLVPSIKIKE